MRFVTGLALSVAALALQGCVSNTYTALSNLSTSCSTTDTSVNCGTGTGAGTGGGTAASGSTGGGGGGTTPPPNGGNTANLPTGDTAIALESNTNITPYGKPALAKLGATPTNTPGTTDQQIWFTTNTASNSSWPVSKTMTYDDYGTCINDGGVNPTTAGVCAGNAGGVGLGGTALGGNYKQYRAYSKGQYDEELQVWAWNNSYATQYRDVTASATSPAHQAWSFGGNYTTAANMPTSGTVDYAGKWGATANTSNFIDRKDSITVPDLSPLSGGGTTTIAQTVSYNNTWHVIGNSALKADFGAGTLKGRLTSTDWLGVNKDNGLTNVNVANAQACANGTPACNATTVAGQQNLQDYFNYNAAFMASDIVLSGTITTDSKNTAKPNQVVGKAEIDRAHGWINSSNNPMFAGFFGTAANGKPSEVTGAFALDATITAPNGGIYPINNDRRAFIQMSGIFNGNCATTGQC